MVTFQGLVAVVEDKRSRAGNPLRQYQTYLEKIILLVTSFFKNYLNDVLLKVSSSDPSLFLRLFTHVALGGNSKPKGKGGEGSKSPKGKKSPYIVLGVIAAA